MSTSVTGPAVAPPSSTSRRTAASAAAARERRVDAALVAAARLRRQPVAPGRAGDAAPARSAPTRPAGRSSLPVTSVGPPPMTPASAIGPRSSVMSRSSGSSARSCPSSVVSRSPGAARRTTTSPDSASRSKACSGWPELEHDVVGDVDGERDRAHAGQCQPALQPRRRRSPQGRGRARRGRRSGRSRRGRRRARGSRPAPASGAGSRPGSRSSSPNAVATSRATPRTDSA